MRSIVFLILVLVTISRKKENNTGYDTRFRGTLKIEFDNVVGSQDLRLTTGNYTNASGEAFTVRALRYFISNISLGKTDGSTYVVPQDSSYFLVDESIRTSIPTLIIPEGEYDRLTFTVGVDSLRSAGDISNITGVLLPSLSTYMNENNGFIFFSMEGTSPASPQGSYRFRIGGYGGKTSATFNNIKTITMDLSAGGISQIREGKESVIHILADVAKVFGGTQNISIASNSVVEFEPFSVNVANNYALMFTHDHTHN